MQNYKKSVIVVVTAFEEIGVGLSFGAASCRRGQWIKPARDFSFARLGQILGSGGEMEQEAGIQAYG